MYGPHCEPPSQKHSVEQWISVSSFDQMDTLPGLAHPKDCPMPLMHYIYNILFVFTSNMDLNDVGAQLDPENDEVFISGLPTDTTEQDIILDKLGL